MLINLAFKSKKNNIAENDLKQLYKLVNSKLKKKKKIIHLKINKKYSWKGQPTG
jgi:hypothetical protein